MVLLFVVVRCSLCSLSCSGTRPWSLVLSLVAVRCLPPVGPEPCLCSSMAIKKPGLGRSGSLRAIRVGRFGFSVCLQVIREAVESVIRLLRFGLVWRIQVDRISFVSVIRLLRFGLVLSVPGWSLCPVVPGPGLPVLPGPLDGPPGPIRSS